MIRIKDLKNYKINARLLMRTSQVHASKLLKMKDSQSKIENRSTTLMSLKFSPAMTETEVES